MKKLFVMIAIGITAACNNRSVDSDKAITDSSIMAKDTSSKMSTDTGTRMLTDTSKSSGDTMVKK